MLSLSWQIKFIMKPTNVGLTKGKTGNIQVCMYPDKLERLCVHVPTTTARKRRDGGQRWVQSKQWLRPPKPKSVVKLGTLLQMSMFAVQSGLRATQLAHSQAEIGHSSVLRLHDFYQLDCCGVCVCACCCFFSLPYCWGWNPGSIILPWAAPNQETHFIKYHLQCV